MAGAALISVPSGLLASLGDTAGWIPFLHTSIGTFSANAEDPVKPPTSGRNEPVSGRSGGRRLAVARDLAAPRAGLDAARLDQPLESLEVPAHRPAREAQRFGQRLERALGLVRHPQL